MVSMVLFWPSVIAGPKIDAKYIQDYTNSQGQMIINVAGGCRGNKPKCLVRGEFRVEKGKVSHKEPAAEVFSLVQQCCLGGDSYQRTNGEQH